MSASVIVTDGVEICGIVDAFDHVSLELSGRGDIDRILDEGVRFREFFHGEGVSLRKR